MKKVLFALLAFSALTFSSCSKDAKINRRIDGSWNVVSIDGETMPSGSSYVMNFTKDKKTTGDGSIVVTDGGATETLAFTYSVTDEVLTFVHDGITETLKVKTYEKKKIEFVDSYSGGDEIWVLEPK
ncbi:MAG: hypothetical protein V4622_06455 [Bacteroidota bacterium]